MTPAERRLPENDDGQHNWGRWLDRFEQERQAVIDLVDSPDVLLTRHNRIGRRRWWDRTGHTVARAIDAARRLGGYRAQRGPGGCQTPDPRVYLAVMRY